jgi:hypothetical protein
MPDDPVAPEQKPVRLPADPDNVPVRVVNYANSGIVGGLVHFTLFTDRVGWDDTGAGRSEHIVAGRVRFDVSVAREIRRQLDINIAALTKPEGKAN